MVEQVQYLALLVHKYYVSCCQEEAVLSGAREGQEWVEGKSQGVGTIAERCQIRGKGVCLFVDRYFCH